MQMEQAIVQWLNNIDFISAKIDHFSDLSQGVAFCQLLNAVDPTFFSLQGMKINLMEEIDKHSTQKLLIGLIEKITQYRQNIQCKQPELTYIDVVDIVQKQNKQQLMNLFELILKVILASNLKGEMIKPILRLDEQSQELLMHFLKQHLEDDEETQGQQDSWESQNNLKQLLQKLDELDKENNRLTTVNYELTEQISELQYEIKNFSSQLENKEQENKILVEQRIQYEKFFEERAQIHQVQEQFEDPKLKQKLLEQERRIANLEMMIEDYKQREKSFLNMKEEFEHLKVQNRKYVQQESQIEIFRERREMDKEIYDKLKERYDRDTAYLKQNLKDILNQMSEHKETKLNLELELQQKQARIDKYQQQITQIESEYSSKIEQMEELMQLLRQQEQPEIIEQPIQDNELNRLSSSKNDHTTQEIDYYIKENHKLEQRVKDLQNSLTDVQLELENRNQKREIENQQIQQQQITMLHDKLKKQTENNEQLKKQIEELKRANQPKKMSQVDYDVSVLTLLHEALQKRVSTLQQSKEQHV